ncbi:hypothetical protein [Pseudolactococcus paracarnosus]|uniref:MORN repeat protein n=1 Tax=Pseudolactococcus paracarnosus TaxID=2749962 RepID=A0ABT0AKT1_9LACT|nr:hypothetical protein [Lactococcus paracarnosus]MCJ1977170.1 hypothetical protein [Lactococcus paracarnosus]MCJ1983334.1 hypothetical protein [Lactococcus paracarnosus]MCJ1998555.1 hypothetical protein [Lactococcus paracarnosus]
MGQTFKEKVAALELKRQAEIANSEQSKSSDKSNDAFEGASVSVVKNELKFQHQTLAIFVSLFVVLFAYLYATDIITFSKNASQMSLDKTFVYKGGMENGNFSGDAVVSDKSGNQLTAKFKSGKIDGAVTYQKKDGYTVTQKTQNQTNVKLVDKTMITKTNDQYTTKTTDFSYTGSWRFAGTWEGNMLFSNKASYKGSWKNGLPNGQGAYTTILGETMDRKFKFGVPQNAN